MLVPKNEKKKIVGVLKIKKNPFLGFQGTGAFIATENLIFRIFLSVFCGLFLPTSYRTEKEQKKQGLGESVVSSQALHENSSGSWLLRKKESEILLSNQFRVTFLLDEEIHVVPQQNFSPPASRKTLASFRVFVRVGLQSSVITFILTYSFLKEKESHFYYHKCLSYGLFSSPLGSFSFWFSPPSPNIFKARVSRNCTYGDVQKSSCIFSSAFNNNL